MKTSQNMDAGRIFSIIAAVIFFVLTCFELSGAIIHIIAWDKELMQAMKNCDIPSVIFGLISALVSAYIGFTLLFKMRTQCVLGYGALFLYKIIEIIFLLSTDGYSKFLVLLADIFVLITVAFIFGTLFEANRLQISYTPPKSRYAIVVLYALFRALRPFFDYKLAGISLNALQTVIIAVNITLYTVAFFFTVKSMVKPIIPKFEQI